jgi:cytochrome c biogenesis protein CcdA
MNVGELMGLFLYGALTFITPCSVGLIAVYLTYLLGVSDDRRKGVVVGLVFVGAMTLTFFVLGILIASLIPVDLSSKVPYLLASVLLVLFGLSSLGLLERVPFVGALIERYTVSTDRSKETLVGKVLKGNYLFASAALALIVSVALGPCSLALVLPVVMASLFTAASPLNAGMMLAVFGLGHSLPVFVLSVVFASTRSRLAAVFSGAGSKLSKVLGVAFILLAVYLLVVNFVLKP